MFIFSTISEAAVRVKGYYRKDGTYVRPHYRSNPDGNPYNNWSFPGNTNPYTGITAPGDPDTYLKNYYKGSSSTFTNPNPINFSPSINNAPLTNVRRLTHVYQYNKCIESFESPEWAIEYAKKWDHAKVIDSTTGNIIWHNYAYHVYQYDNYLESFLSIDAALKYAQKWDHVKLYDGLSQNIIWKNF